MEDITRSYVEKFVRSWEGRHDAWVRSHFAPLLGTEKRTMSEIRPVLKMHLESDWRHGLAFFIDRTTYQSRKDKVNILTATYLYEKILSLNRSFSSDNLRSLIEKIKHEKSWNIVTHIRETTDIQRLEFTCEYLIESTEKNFTQIVLSKVNEGAKFWKFFDQFPYVSSKKTGQFYMKFISWALDLDVVSVTVDRHVYNSLQTRKLISGQNQHEATNVITNLSHSLGIPAVNLETALYEESWLKSNSTTTGYSGCHR